MWVNRLGKYKSWFDYNILTLIINEAKITA